jgi:hypothetical protein
MKIGVLCRTVAAAGGFTPPAPPVGYLWEEEVDSRGND